MSIGATYQDCLFEVRRPAMPIAGDHALEGTETAFEADALEPGHVFVVCAQEVSECDASLSAGPPETFGSACE